MLRKDMKKCIIHKNYCSAYVRTVTARFSIIVHSVRSRGSSFIAVFFSNSITGFRSTIHYGFIYQWFKRPHGLFPQSRSAAVGKGTLSASNYFRAIRSWLDSYSFFQNVHIKLHKYISSDSPLLKDGFYAVKSPVGLYRGVATGDVAV